MTSSSGRSAIIPLSYFPGLLPAGADDASLLDYLEVSQVVLFVYSTGDPSAIQFALRHRDRTTALVLVASALPGNAGAPPRFIARTLLGSDASFFWLLRRLVPTQPGRLMGVPAGLRLTPEQRIAVAEAEEGLFPVAPRKDSILFELYVSNPAAQDAPGADHGAHDHHQRQGRPDV